MIQVSENDFRNKKLEGILGKSLVFTNKCNVEESMTSSANNVLISYDPHIFLAADDNIKYVLISELRGKTNLDKPFLFSIDLPQLLGLVPSVKIDDISKELFSKKVTELTKIARYCMLKSGGFKKIKDYQYHVSHSFSMEYMVKNLIKYDVTDNKNIDNQMGIFIDHQIVSLKKGYLKDAKFIRGVYESYFPEKTFNHLKKVILYDYNLLDETLKNLYSIHANSLINPSSVENSESVIFDKLNRHVNSNF